MAVKKKLALVFIILIIIFLSLWYWQESIDTGISETGASAVLEQSLGRNLKEDNLPDVWQKHQGEYFEIDIPPGAVEYDLNKQGSKPKDTLERYSFDSNSPRMIFVATVSDSDKMQVKTFDDIPAVTMRMNKSNEYKKYSIKGSGLGFVKTNSQYENTAFYIENKKVYTFSLTSEYQSGTLDLVFEKMLMSLILK